MARLWHDDRVMIRTHTALALAETVRAACLDAARQAYEDAGIRGLCADGRWEAALSAMRQMDLFSVLDTAKRESAGLDRCPSAETFGC